MRTLFKSRTSSAPWFAVEISAESVRLAQVDLVSQRRRVVMYERIPGAPADALAKLRKRLHATSFRCSQLLGSGQYQIQLTEAPSVPENELRDALRWRLKDMLDYPVDQATLDFVTVPTDPAAPSRHAFVLAVSARNEVVGEQMRLFREARFPLHAVDIPEMAQRNVASLYEEPGRALAMLAFGEDGALLTFTSGGELFLSRHTEITPVQLGSLDEDVRAQALDRLILELQRSIDHFDRQFSYVPLSRVLVVSHGVDGLVEHLRASVDLPVEELSLTDAFDFSGVPALQSADAQVAAMHLLGATMRMEA